MAIACPSDSPAPGRSTIVVVEDEVIVRLMLAEHLRAHGYAVVEAADADEALSVLGSSVKVDLVFTDVHMPGALDGIGLAHRVHATYPGVKIVMGSGQVWHTKPREALDGFFAKPYDLPKLVAHIGVLLAGER